PAPHTAPAPHAAPPSAQPDVLPVAVPDPRAGDPEATARIPLPQSGSHAAPAAHSDETARLSPVRPAAQHQAPPPRPQQPPQPEAEFGGVDATRQMPPVGAPIPPPAQPPYVPPRPAAAMPQQPGPRPEPQAPTSMLQGMYRDRDDDGGGFDNDGAYPAAYDDGARRRSNKRAGILLGGGVVVILAAGALVIGALSSSGSPSGSGPTTAASASAHPGKPVTGASKPAAESPEKAQAVALNGLLSQAGASRSTVVDAVARIGRCDNPRDAAGKLRGAAGQREALLKRLATLKVDKLPNGAQLVAALRTAWGASKQADSQFAEWGDEAGGGKKCRKHTAGRSHYSAGVAASGTASKAKQQAVDLWTPIAQQTGQPTYQAVQL
ncbi:hypothetical protein BIV57_15745, partial [Mangrovactinospora gilvigrisea]